MMYIHTHILQCLYQFFGRDSSVLRVSNFLGKCAYTLPCLYMFTHMHIAHLTTIQRSNSCPTILSLLLLCTYFLGMSFITRPIWLKKVVYNAQKHMHVYMGKDSCIGLTVDFRRATQQYLYNLKLGST